MPGYDLTLLHGDFAVARLDPAQPIPAWALQGSPVSVTRTDEELSVVCREGQVPSGVRSQGGWRCLMVRGPLDFALSGVLAALAQPLAQAEVPIFALSTYDTDYILVPGASLEAALRALAAAGHSITRA